MTKLTLTTNYGSVEITVNKDDMNVMDMFEDLIIPALLASGYTEESINGYMDCTNE